MKKFSIIISLLIFILSSTVSATDQPIKNIKNGMPVENIITAESNMQVTPNKTKSTFVSALANASYNPSWKIHNNVKITNNGLASDFSQGGANSISAAPAVGVNPIPCDFIKVMGELYANDTQVDSDNNYAYNSIFVEINLFDNSIWDVNSAYVGSVHRFELAGYEDWWPTLISPTAYE